MFVVTADKLGGNPTSQFSYGPSKSGTSPDPGNLVALAGTDTPTGRADAAAWTAAADPQAAAEAGLVVQSLTEQGYSDDAITASGNNVNALVGTPGNPGPTSYQLLPVNGANSNSAATAVINGAASGGQGRYTPPAGVIAPGHGQSDNVGKPLPKPSCYKSPSCS